MADSRRIIRGLRQPTGSNDDVPRTREVAATQVRTVARTIDGSTATEGSPEQLLSIDERRRTADVYNPATDPEGTVATQATVWVAGDENPQDGWFPLEAGATVPHDSSGPLWVWTDPADESRLYIHERRDA